MTGPSLIRTAVLALGSAIVLVASSPGLAQQESALGPPTASGSALSSAPPVSASAAEIMRLRDGMAAAQSGDWYGLAQLRDGASDPIVRKMLQWRLASAAEAPLYFDDLSQALAELQGWPGRTTMRQRAEEAIFDSRLSASERIAFLRQDNGPITGNGRIALAMALRDAGQRSEANEIARAAWREDALNDAIEDRAQANFSDVFTQDDYAARVDGLLWRGSRSAAERLMSRLSPADRALANARIALQTRPRRGLQAAVDAVPSSRSDNPGLLYDRAQYIRRTDRPIEAMAVAARIDAREAPLAARDDIFRERRLYVPRALRGGQQQLAYQLVSNTGLTSGEEFADGEWMSGWLQLRFLRNAQRASEHFSHLAGNVSSPVSSSRALYWQAEAARALGQTAEADAILQRAARFQFTYYGQLAALRLDPQATMSLQDNASISNEARARFESRELVRALRLMAQVGAQRDFESIAFYLDDTLDDPQEIELLSQLAREQSYSRTALRSAKAGLFRNVVAVNAAYPLLQLPSVVEQRGRPESALVLAIIRQESEFDQYAVSSANAHGLMQLIPSTARMTANRYGLSFDRTALTSDPSYNMTLGAAHLSDLLDDWRGSYVLSIASYNAGAFNAQSWIGDWGDPRSSSVDVIDWIELIPFSETRNYVQRVLENTQVYRYRLAGRPVRIELQDDLRRGRY